MLFRKKEQKKSDSGGQDRIPVLRQGIHHGEQIVGFQDPDTGKIEEVMTIRTMADMERFMELYGVDPQEIQRL